ncbi:MAG: GNAT family N-acetyltransferase [Armatimonadota bacterium]|nr:GNAT family N-acetyltransferase [Armatimonadota bacterium]MDR5689199.1 GNAT family N-acetyltransferase [Armatimonadota bacterium]MDR7388650.1 GNAT family N-acetyltransferase [Armatimonadota bacterium]MDR7397120.1 GNAT family N-acetyltransferase [Armatimonadota bacterium]MDR7405646.1 GNAT family N-acetyltransferase [Armatimonadota bacterium]
MPAGAFRDRRGRPVQVGEYRPEDRGLLVAMYRSFDPDQRAQGIPPLHPLRLADWLEVLTEEGVNVVARCEGRVVGHAVLVPDRAGSHELAIFVHQDYQGAGIGNRLLQALLELGRARGVRHVWLTVEPWNGRAQALYRRAGFERSAADPWEEVWELELGGFRVSGPPGGTPDSGASPERSPGGW